MAKTYDIKVNAENPNLPLQPLYVFVNSPTSPRVTNVPQNIGSWKLTRVYFVANLPDNSVATVEAVNESGVWIATIPACDSVGTSALGFQVVADGFDERGASITGYALGHGDLVVLPRDGTITVGETVYYFHFLDEVPETPHKGDAAMVGGVLKWYDGTAWKPFGGGTSDYEELENLPTVGGADLKGAMLDTALAGKAAVSHQHPASDLSDLFTAWVDDDLPDGYYIGHVYGTIGWCVKSSDHGNCTPPRGNLESTELDFTDYDFGTARRDRLALASQIPTVPTNVSAFTNDAGYLTAHQDISGKADKNDFDLDETTGVPSVEYVQSLFSKDDTSDTDSLELKNKVLQDSIDARIKNAVSSLDPDTASVYDIITALKGE